jgi:hypothetical protein
MHRGSRVKGNGGTKGGTWVGMVKVWRVRVEGCVEVEGDTSWGETKGRGAIHMKVGIASVTSRG